MLLDEVVEEAGIPFLVRVVSNLARKREAEISRPRQLKTNRNPFLPYENELFVAEIGDSHVCLLNKFNVVDHHLLIVTREFEDQQGDGDDGFSHEKARSTGGSGP